jgi:chromosome partitioning protein
MVLSGKGGTGKTTTALNLSCALAERGHRTLLMDLDPQGGIGLALAKADTEWIGLAEVILKQTTLSKAIFQTKLKNLFLLPRGRLDAINVMEYEQNLSTTKILSEVLDQMEKEVDYVLIDAPSGLGHITRIALALTHFALIPIQAEPMALRAVGQVLRVIDYVKKHENPSLKLLGLLPTMVQLDQDTSFAVTERIWSELAGVMQTYIPRRKEYALASEKGLPISFLGGEISPEARRFDLLAEEIEQCIARHHSQKEQIDDRPERSLV